MTSFRIFDGRDEGRGRARGGGSYAPASEAASTASEVAFLRAKLREAEDVLKDLREEPALIATVLEIRQDDERMTISPGPGGVLDVAYFEGAKVGDRVTCSRNTMAVIAILRDDVPCGITVTITRGNADGGELIEAEIMGQTRILRTTSGHVFQKGERAIVDPGLQFAIGSLGMPPQTLTFAGKVSVGWDAIGGHAEAKEALREAIELPFSHPELFAKYGKRPSRGVLLSGPSGTGKTMLGKAAATALARAHGHSASEGFVYVKGPELLSSYVGKTEEAIRRLFLAARDHKARHGYPALVFMDEAESLLGVRDRGANISMAATIVPQFLAEMDGLDDAAAMFLLATNRPDMLDPAIVRDGRIDRKVRVGRPSAADARQIFAIHLADRPLAKRLEVDALLDMVVPSLYHDDRVVQAYGDRALRLRDFASGAMIAGIVEHAATAAMLRDVVEGKGKPTGIMLEDLLGAIDRAQASVKDTYHGEAIADLIKEGT